MEDRGRYIVCGGYALHVRKPDIGYTTGFKRSGKGVQLTFRPVRCCISSPNDGNTAIMNVPTVKALVGVVTLPGLPTAIARTILIDAYVVGGVG